MLSCPCGLSKQEYWSWLPFPPPGDLPGMEPIFPTSPALAGRFFSMESRGKHPVLVGKHQPKEQKVWGVIVRKVEFFHVNCSSEIRHEINNHEKKTTFSNSPMLCSSFALYRHLISGGEDHWHSGKLLLNSSVQFSCSVVSDSLRPHKSKHARPPCLSPTPRVYSNSCPLSR